LRQHPSALGVVDGSYCLIQKMSCTPVPLSLTRFRSMPPRPACPSSPLLTCAPTTRPSHQDSDAPASTRLPTTPGLHFGYCASAGASPSAFALATAHPSSDILNTKRTPTPMPQPVTYLLHTTTMMPQSAPVLLCALMLSATRPPRPNTD
jgi:hypothetical protein